MSTETTAKIKRSPVKQAALESTAVGPEVRMVLKSKLSWGERIAQMEPDEASKVRAKGPSPAFLSVSRMRARDPGIPRQQLRGAGDGRTLAPLLTVPSILVSSHTHPCSLARTDRRFDDADKRPREDSAVACDSAFAPIVLEMLLKIATLRLDEARTDDAVEIVAAILEHPAAGERIRDAARELVTGLGVVTPGRNGMASISSGGWAFDAVVRSIITERTG